MSGTFLDNSGASLSVLRATRAAKLGARYGRLMRILKLMKFMDYLPCFKRKDANVKEPTMSAVRRVSNEMSSIVSLRVAAVVMLLVIIVPFLAYTDIDYSPRVFMENLKYAAKNSSSSSYDISHIADKFNDFYKNKQQKLVYVSVSSPFFATQEYTHVTRSTLRSDNTLTDTLMYSAFGSTSKSYKIQCIMDITFQNQQNSMFGIILIILVIFCLVSFSGSFQSAMDKLLILPLEKMMTTVRTSATIMLKNMKVIEEEKKKEEGVDDEEEGDFDGELETDVLEALVEKVARIVKNVIPGGSELEVDKNVDNATASWLASTYATINKVVTKEVAKGDEAYSDASKNMMNEMLSTITAFTDLDTINSWNFDVLKYKNSELYDVVIYVFSSLHFFEDFNIHMDTFRFFIHEIATKYIDSNTYHNFKHGVDVLHANYRLIMVPSLNEVFTRLEMLSMLVAALAHDVGHPGVNNVFLVKAKDKLALAHNDKSPLENMHCAVLYDILSHKKFNIFNELTEQQWRDVRKIIITCILGTDMSHHFEQISKVQLFLEVNGPDIKKFCVGEKDNIDCFSDDANRIFVMEILLHSSDISNPYKPFHICMAWADLVVEEFGRQGDREKAENLEVSPMMDRNLIVLCNMQMGFIEFVVTPLINAVVNTFPPLYEMSQNISNNYCMWGQKRQKEIMVDDKVADKAGEVAKLDERMGKFRDKQAFSKELGRTYGSGNRSKGGGVGAR